jgi:hypothetical protein
VAPTRSRRRRPAIGAARVDGLHMDAHRIDDKAITIDGHVDEAAWKQVPLVPELVQFEPRFGFHPTHPTDVRIAYGQRGIYVAFVCYGDPKKVRGGVFRKDQLGPSDQVWLEIDPNNNDTNGYVFVTNPSGSQEDAQLFLDDSEELAVGRRVADRRQDHDAGLDVRDVHPVVDDPLRGPRRVHLRHQRRAVVNDDGEVEPAVADPAGPPGPHLVGPRLPRRQGHRAGPKPRAAPVHLVSASPRGGPATPSTRRRRSSRTAAST